MEFWIASYPRSGNTYLRLLLRNRYGVVSTPAPSRRPATRTVPGSDFFQPYFRDEHAVAGVEGMKTHGLPPPGDARPAVYLVRDGRDALTSYAHYALAFVYDAPPAEVTTDRLRETLRNLILERGSAYGTWAENVEAWAGRGDTLVVRYEELVADPAGTTDRIVAGLGLTLPVVSEALPSFGELKTSDPRFFRRGSAGGWRELFTPELLDLFREHNGAAMRRFGYGDAKAA